MLSCTESQRRCLCRAIFFAAGLAPLAAIAGLGAFRQSQHRSAATDYALLLSETLGLAVEVDAVVYVRPGLVRLERLRFADPHSGVEAGRCSALELDTAEWAPGAGRLRVRPHDVEVQTAGMRRLATWLDDALRTDLPRRIRPFDLAPCKVTIHHGSAAHTLVGVTATSTADETTRSVEIKFTLANESAKSQATVRARREQRDGRSWPKWEIEASGSGIPGDLLAPWFAVEGWLGSSVALRGRLTAELTPSGWQGAIERARIANVSLDALVTSHFPHTLNGAADIDIDEAVFADGRLAHARGQLESRAGQIGGSLLEAAAEAWRTELGEFAPPSGEAGPYRKLAFAFHISAYDGSNSPQLRLEATGRTNGALILDERHRPLLFEPAEPVDVITLAQVLSPEAGVQAPATRETDLLVRVLPLPSTAKDRTAAGPTARPKGIQK